MSNSYQLLNPAEFMPDMKLHRIDVCFIRKDNKVNYMAFTLRTLASKLVTVLEMDFLGRKSDSEDCSFFIIEDAAKVEFMEATYDKFITSFTVKIQEGKIKEWGSRQVLDKSYRWDYTREQQPVGFEGYNDYYGITSLGVIYYNVTCAEQILGYSIVPLGQDYNDDLQNSRGYVAPEEIQLTWWEKFQQHEYFEVFKWIAIALIICLLMFLIVCICRCFCLKKVRVDPRGLSQQDLKNPEGSIKLTVELQKKM